MLPTQHLLAISIYLEPPIIFAVSHCPISFSSKLDLRTSIEFQFTFEVDEINHSQRCFLPPKGIITYHCRGAGTALFYPLYFKHHTKLAAQHLPYITQTKFVDIFRNYILKDASKNVVPDFELLGLASTTSHWQSSY